VTPGTCVGHCLLCSPPPPHEEHVAMTKNFKNVFKMLSIGRIGSWPGLDQPLRSVHPRPPAVHYGCNSQVCWRTTHSLEPCHFSDGSSRFFSRPWSVSRRERLTLCTYKSYMYKAGQLLVHNIFCSTKSSTKFSTIHTMVPSHPVALNLVALASTDTKLALVLNLGE
jgi:hypothetical protein